MPRKRTAKENRKILKAIKSGKAEAIPGSAKRSYTSFRGPFGIFRIESDLTPVLAASERRSEVRRRIPANRKKKRKKK